MDLETRHTLAETQLAVIRAAFDGVSRLGSENGELSPALARVYDAIASIAGEELIELVPIMTAEGNHDHAVRLAQAVVKEARLIDQDFLHKPLSALGSAYVGRGDHLQAERAFSDALEAAEKNGGVSEEFLAENYELLSQSQIEQGKIRDAVTSLRAAARIYSEDIGDNDKAEELQMRMPAMLRRAQQEDGSTLTFTNGS